MFTKKTVLKVFLLAFLSYIIYLFRPEHGLFSITLLFLYLYLFLFENNYRNKGVIIFGGFVAVLVVLFLFRNQIAEGLSTISNTTNSYSNLSLSSAGSNSFGAQLLKLPFGIRHITIGLFSQTLPFPFYDRLDNIGMLPLSIAAIFWFVIWIILLTGLFYKRKSITGNKKAFYLFLISCLLVLGATSNADTRRIMCVFPVFYLASMLVLYSYKKEQRLRIIVLGIGSYALLITGYLLLKS
ncbi:hypothetical protein [Niabella sp.]|uniref:hypothetical protein n=1 Tax=Niabella sp. TaxID=1962976 RepID=UPI002634118F|nr:hypothetical protein [Niabella sp.]